MHSVPFFDKIGHILLIGTLAFLLNRALAARTVAGVQLGGLLVAAAMTLEECSQVWFPARSFDYADMAANLAGVACADILTRLVGRRRAGDSVR
jgi:VanZ family protein